MHFIYKYIAYISFYYTKTSKCNSNSYGDEREREHSNPIEYEGGVIFFSPSEIITDTKILKPIRFRKVVPTQLSCLREKYICIKE
jgi:hypothetical protein